MSADRTVTAAAAALTATFLARFPGVPVAPSRDRDNKPVPGGGTSGALSRVFAELIAIDAAAAQAAADLAAARHRIANTLPTEGAIRAAFAELLQGERRSGLEAWGDVLALFRRGFSRHRPPTAADVADPLVWQCLDAMTWRAICIANEDDPAPRSQFVASYQRLAERRGAAGVTATVPTAKRLLEQRSMGELLEGVLEPLAPKQLGGGERDLKPAKEPA